MTNIYGGWLYGDWALCILAGCAALAGYSATSNMRKGRIRRACSFFIGLGWTLLFMRLYSMLSAGQDPLISPMVLVGLSLVTSAYTLHEIVELNLRNVCYGRRHDDGLPGSL